MFLNKIDKRILNMVNSQSVGGKVSCLVYANNYALAKKYLENNVCKNMIEYPFIKAFGIRADVQKIETMAQKSQIKYISSVTKVFAQMDKTREIMNINKAQKTLSGKGVTVAVIDTGLCENLDFCSFGNRLLCFKDFINHKTTTYDDNGHGTFVTGCICGNGFMSGKKYRGVAPGANIVMCKALDSNGETGALTILEAMQWIYDNKQKYNIRVVCMSFGSQPLQSGDPLMLGAEALWNSGIVVVAAAGNSGPSAETIKSPGTSGKIITVGALDDGRENDNTNFKNFKVAQFSSRGPAYPFYKPDCIACGVDIISTTCKNLDFYTKMSGTSVATPIIAGSCALLLEKEPNLSPFAVKNKLTKCCKAISGNRNYEGFGILDVEKFCKWIIC